MAPEVGRAILIIECSRSLSPRNRRCDSKVPNPRTALSISYPPAGAIADGARVVLDNPAGIIYSWGDSVPALEDERAGQSKTAVGVRI